MTQEEKQILLKNLCARLPYGIKCKDQYGEYIDVNLYNAHIEHLIDQILSGVVQMVLRPMSSMTEEEKKELSERYAWKIKSSWIEIKYHSDGYWDNDIYCPTEEYLNLFDWLNAHHFDYCGLIEKGLALEAPEEMYKIE